MMARVLLVALIMVSLPTVAQAEQVSVSATVEEETPTTPADTVVVFRGIAYPNSTVTIKRGRSILTEVPADPAARFDISLGGQPSGTSTYTIYAVDAEGRLGSDMNFTLNIAQGSTITLTGIFLGPTIEADKSSLQLDETITILGITAPESDVTIFVATGEEQTFTTTADGSGLWSKQILAADIGVGSHTATAKAVAPTSEISDSSQPVEFTIQPTPDKCDGKNRADLNCDGKVDLTDFSILLFYWRQTDPKNARADMNNDRIVNLTDFSILLFNWSD